MPDNGSASGRRVSAFDVGLLYLINFCRSSSFALSNAGSNTFLEYFLQKESNKKIMNLTSCCCLHKIKAVILVLSLEQM